MRIPDAVHEELLNWSRWCWQGEWPHPLPPTHCGSLESQFRAPPEWDMDMAEAPTLAVQPNDRNARKVQAVYDSLPDSQRAILQAEYPQRHKYKGRAHTATALGMPLWLYETGLSAVIAKVEKAFEICA